MALIQGFQGQLKDGRKVMVRSALESDASDLLACMRTILDDGEGVVLLPEFRSLGASPSGKLLSRLQDSGGPCTSGAAGGASDGQ